MPETIKEKLQKRKDIDHTVYTNYNNKNIVSCIMYKNGDYANFQYNGQVSLFYDAQSKRTTYYKDDGKTIDSVQESKNGEIIFYKADGKTIDTVRHKDDSITYYKNNKKAYDFIPDDNSPKPEFIGTYVYYRSDGKTVDFKKDKNNNEVHYKEDGKTIDYFVVDGQRKDKSDVASALKVQSLLGTSALVSHLAESIPQWAKEAETKLKTKVATKKTAPKKKTTITKTSVKKSVKSR